MNIRTRLALPIATLLLAACGQRPEIATMPPEARPGWDRCESAVVRWCSYRSNGAPTEERDCVSEASRGYASQADEAGRTTYMRAHGCTQ